MPREVDHGERRREILDATLRVLADVGPRGLTMRSIARELGGSASVVTHYYPTRGALLGALGPWLQEKWQAQLDVIVDESDDPRGTLRSVLIWMLPLSEEASVEERAVLSLLSTPRNDERSVGEFHAETEAWMIDLIRTHVDGLVRDQRGDSTVSLLRALTRGITLCALANPVTWSAERQLGVLDELLGLLGLQAA